jgi:hypothetical protein
MKRRVLTSILGAILLVGVLAGPAVADEGGRHHYSWPAHDCSGSIGTHLDLYIHTWIWWKTYAKMDGRLEFWSGTCANAARSIHIYRMTLWQYNNGHWVNVEGVGAHDLDVTSGHGLTTTSDHACDGSRKYHVEAVYKIYWKDGTSTAQRDDNSDNWNATVFGGQPCASPSSPIKK